MSNVAVHFLDEPGIFVGSIVGRGEHSADDNAKLCGVADTLSALKLDQPKVARAFRPILELAEREAG